jgi:hypothetical protein
VKQVEAEMEPQPGRLAVWRVENGGDTLRLEIDLDCDRGVTLTIDPNGRATATLSDPHFAAWLAAEAHQGAEP